ncbi:hypothetical protein D3C81_1249740 [compost metagenome]
MEFRLVALQAQQAAFAHQSAEAADAQAVAAFRAVHFMQVGQAAVAQDDAVRRDEVGVVEQQQVHGRVAGGWSPLSSSCGWLSRLRIRRLNSTPASNSIHIGTASRVCDSGSGGVRIMPTTKQPTIT